MTFLKNFISLLMASAVEQIKTAIIESEKKQMSAIADLAGTLNGVTTKLQSIDTAVKALVAAAANTTLDTPTQAALDALVAETGTLATDAGTGTAAS